MYNYVSHRQNTVAQFIVTRPIMELCLAAEWRLGAKGAQLVVETEQGGCRGDVEGGLGGGTDGVG